MKVSIVIPVYNEAASLVECLQAISKQTVKPWEVIVVDNNSDDASRNIARSFDFVTVIDEPKQGVLHARTTGFDASSGDIIARIDADTVLPYDWLNKLQMIFASTEVDAVSGTAQYYNVAFAPFFDSLDLYFRRKLSQKLGDRVFLWGANMAIRRDAWKNVKSELCNEAGIHEDFDIAIHLQEIGGTVGFDESISAKVSSRRVDTDYISFLKYAWASPATYAKHEIKARRHMYQVVAICAIGYFPARLLYKGYDSDQNSFSWGKFFSQSTSIPRVDPTANIV